MKHKIGLVNKHSI